MIFMLDVPKALAATGKSDRRLGSEVLAVWRRLEKERNTFPQPNAIGAKLGRLRRGDTKWWTNQPRALDGLAHLLGCKPDDIVPADDSAPGAVPIAAFSELMPILPGQDPCQLQDDGSWLGTWADSLLYQEPRTWIVAPTGSGKSLAIRILGQRHGARIRTMRCRRLVEALPEGKLPLPLVVEVSELDLATDEVALKELSRMQAHVCVLAPFSRHVVRGAGRSQWRDVSWTPNGQWRERLAKWVHARLPKPDDLDVEDVMLFLQGIDPREDLFTTPGDVLAVAARAYRGGLPTGSSALRELARESLGRLFSGNESSWVRTFGVAAVEALVEARLVATDHLAEPLLLGEWAHLLPTELTPVVPPNSKAKPKHQHSAESVPSVQAVRLLADAEVLRATTEGRYDFAPWVRAAIERERIRASFKAADLGWALWGLEPTRRVIVDDALEATTPATLLRLARQALTADGSDLRTVAAVEALFSALARKLAGEWKPSSEMFGDLQKLGLRQLELVLGLPEGRGFPGSAPLTRQGHPHRRNEVASWIGEAWTFSTTVPPPKARVESGWILPGWSRSLRLADAPEMLPFVHEDQRLVAASRAVVRACIDDELPRKVPYALLPWVIIDGPSRGWTLTKEVQLAFLGTTGVAQTVGHLLSSEPRDVRALGARSAWDAALLASGGQPLHALGVIARTSPDVHRVVLDDLPAQAFESAFRAKHPITGDDGRLLRGLPPRLVRPALEAVVEQMERDQRPVHDIEQVLEELGNEDLDLLLRLGTHGFGQGYAAARRVWSLSPNSALEQARAAMTAGARTAQVWFDTAPAQQIPALLGALRAHKAPTPPWCAVWLANALPRAGHAAPEVFTLLRSLGGSP